MAEFLCKLICQSLTIPAFSSRIISISLTPNAFCLICMCMRFLAQKIHISENAKEALEQIGSYHIVFRGSMEVKVN